MSGAGERRQLVWLDLCSGLGGASQPALDRGWKVITVDIDPRFSPTIVADVRALPLKPFHVDVLWASPPCNDFSKWGKMRTFYPNPPDPDLSVLRAVCLSIANFTPDWFIVENVSGAAEFFKRPLGPVRATSGSHWFWGKIPGLIPQSKSHKGGDYKDWKSRVRRVRESCYLPESWTGRGFPNIHQAAAKIPYEIGEAICAAVERRQAEA